MRVGDLQVFEDALDGAVLAVRTMQRVERNVGSQVRQHARDIAPHIHARDAVAHLFESIRAGIAGRQRHGPLGRKSAHQNSDVFACHAPLRSGWR